MPSVPAAPAGLRRAGLGADGLETGARGRGARAPRALMLPSLLGAAMTERFFRDLEECGAEAVVP